MTVGLLNACYAFKGLQVSTERLAKEACEIEIDIVGKPIGKQDQYAAAYGGVNEIIFYKGGRVEVSPVQFPSDKLRVLGSNLLLLYTGITRKSDPILQKQNEKLDLNLKELQEMRDQVPILKNHLENEENYALGPVLELSWSTKKSFLSGISNQRIDSMYETALKAGATGGKICGAGGGGFLLLYVPREKQNSIRKALREYRELPFMLEKYGSRIIFSQMSDYWR